jgi:hypothetical protein
MIRLRVAWRAVNLRETFRFLAVTGLTAILAYGLALALPLEPMGAFGRPIVVGAVISALSAWRPVHGLVAFGIVVLMAETVAFWTGADIRYVDEAALVLLAATAVTIHRRKLTLTRPGWRAAAALALVGAGVLSSLANEVPPSIWIPGLALLTKGIAFFYLVTSLPVDEEDIGPAMGSLLIVGLLLVAVGLVEFVAPDLGTALGVPPYREQRGAVDVVTSWFTQPSLYGWIAVFLSLFLFADFAVRRARWSLALAILLGGASVLSGRRIPLLGWIAGLIFGALHQSGWRGGSRRAWLLIAGGVLGVVLVSMPLLGGFYRSTVEDYFHDVAAVGEIFSEEPDAEVVRPIHPRIALYAGSMAVARDEFPLGAGIGRYGSHLSREEYSPMYARYGLDRVYGLRERRPIAITDTFWPMVLGETGAAGLLAALAFFAMLGRDLWRAAGPVASVTVRVFTLGALLVYVEALVRSTVSGVFVAPPIVYWVFGAAALSLALRRGVVGTPSGGAAPPPGPR